MGLGYLWTKCFMGTIFGMPHMLALRQDWEGMESPRISGAGTSKEIQQLQAGKGLVLNHGDRARKGDGGRQTQMGSDVAKWSLGIYFVATTL